jgi:hypothetical protein
LVHQAGDSKVLADFFRDSPWTVELINKPSQKFMLAQVLELAAKAGMAPKIRVSLEDSPGRKGKAAKHLDAVDYHHNHIESNRTGSKPSCNPFCRLAWLPPDRKMKRFRCRRGGRQEMVFLPFCFPERLRMGRISVGLLKFDAYLWRNYS